MRNDEDRSITMYLDVCEFTRAYDQVAVKARAIDTLKTLISFRIK